MPEILGDAAAYFNPENEAEVAGKIKHIIDDGNLRQKLVSAGWERIKKYDWLECAEKTLAIYKSV